MLTFGRFVLERPIPPSRLAVDAAQAQKHPRHIDMYLYLAKRQTEWIGCKQIKQISSRAADCGALGCFSLAFRFIFQALTYSEDIFAAGGDTHHPTGCKHDASESILCYKASINNPTRTRSNRFDEICQVKIAKSSL